MKYLLFFLSISVLVTHQACSKKVDNDALYDEVMKIHDEVMPKMNDLYKMKEDLKKQAADTLITEEKRKELEEQIDKIETAGKSMMVWMREFNPPADSLGEIAVHQYLEGQLEAVKKVKANILEVLPAENK